MCAEGLLIAAVLECIDASESRRKYREGVTALTTAIRLSSYGQAVRSQAKSTN
uniref:Uncharacterized protein n=1 Tax=Rhizobium rhizogenes TaxID=359 RepID=A0A7S4ZTD3_RHIRH|nr:hypothetical protein pC5.8b_379 [Rhizobium rhizogenes]